LLTQQFGTTDLKAIVKDLLKQKYQLLTNKSIKSSYLLTDTVKKMQKLSGTTLKTLTATY
jgi:hypothetical protein